MATVTGLTAARMLEIEAASVVDGDVIGDNLILTKHDGSTVDAGNVRGPQGPQGLQGPQGPQGIQGPEGPSKPATALATPDTLALRNSAGRIQIAAPVQVADASNKGYVDDSLEEERKFSLSQHLLSGGGIRKVTDSGISWSNRFVVIGLGNRSFSTSGYFDVGMPPNGTTITVYGRTGVSSITVSSGRIPMGTWSALYYILPINGGHTSVASNFRIVEYYDAMSIDIPNTWILIAVRNNDPLTPAVKWGDGRVQDYWKTLSLLNNWVPFGGEWPVPAWKFGNEGQVMLRGLMKFGSAAISFTTLDASIAPYGVLANGGCLFTTLAGPGLARIDVFSSGQLWVREYLAGGTNGHVSLDGIFWVPNGH